MNLRTVNQNLLPILRALLRERSVSRAAVSLRLSQPAASKALDQLRGILGDPLLVRSGHEMALTQRGEALLGPVDAACRALEAIWQPVDFDPATSRREFVIAGSDYCATLLVPRLAGPLANLAPSVSMLFVDNLPEQLLDDALDIDFAIAPTSLISHRVAASGTVTPLFVEDFVAVAGIDHPLVARTEVTPDDIAAARSVMFGHDEPLMPGASFDPQPFREAVGPPLASVHQLTALPLLALLSGTVTIVPARLAEVMSTCMPLRILPRGAPPLRVEFSIVWTHRRETDADHRWFRDLVIEHLRDESQPDVRRSENRAPS